MFTDDTICFLPLIESRAFKSQHSDFTLNNLKVSVRFFFFKTRFGTNVIR